MTEKMRNATGLINGTHLFDVYVITDVSNDYFFVGDDTKNVAVVVPSSPFFI